MSRESLREAIAALTSGQRPATFRERMVLQMRVIEALAAQFDGDLLAATEAVAPVFAETF